RVTPCGEGPLAGLVWQWQECLSAVLISDSHTHLRCAPGRPSVLAVTSEVPWPLDSGGHLRTYHLLRALAADLPVRVVAPTVAGRVGESRAALKTAGLDPSIVTLPPRNLATESVRAMAAAISRKPYVLFARHRHRQVRRTLEWELGRHAPDVLYFDHLDSLVYAGDCPATPIVLDMHNVYSRLASRMAGEAAGALQRNYLAHEAALLDRMEQRAVRLAHTVLAVSVEEAQYFRALGAPRVVVVPNGVDCEAFGGVPIAKRGGPPTILYVGTLSWPPNASAARFLATEVLPAVQRRLPDARLLIVGRDPGPEVIALARPGSGIEVAANVPDVMPYYRAASMLAVPLDAGGGTRLKILEAFAAGMPVLSTRVGCEGIDAVAGEHLELAERGEFAGAAIRLLLDPDRSCAIAARARLFARQHYDWSVGGARARDAVAVAAGDGPWNRAAFPAAAIAATVPAQ
ncbi:MAG: glycosyltransferase family 4 protein, partial [Vicinamibacterales bacterium]